MKYSCSQMKVKIVCSSSDGNDCCQWLVMKVMIVVMVDVIDIVVTYMMVTVGDVWSWWYL